MKACTTLLGVWYPDVYAQCCRPEKLRTYEEGGRNKSLGLHAGIARQRFRQGNPECWQIFASTNVSGSGIGYKSCCSFVYQRILGVDHSGRKHAVRFLPAKSTRFFEVDLRPVVKQKVILRQRQYLGSQFFMSGYSGVLWPGSLALANLLLHEIIEGKLEGGRRCLELGAGFAALPSLVMASSQLCSNMLATDLPGVVHNVSRLANLQVGDLDMCSERHIQATRENGTFDLILSADGICQTNCGINALLQLSTRDTRVHMIVRSDPADLARQQTLLDNFFVETFRLGLTRIGQMQPGEFANYVIWQRKFGPHSCWISGEYTEYTFEKCCIEGGFSKGCFDEIHSRQFCCGEL